MRPDSYRQTASREPARPVMTPERLSLAIAEGRRLQGQAVRQAFAGASHFLAALPGKLIARFRSQGTSGSCYGPAR